MTATAGLPAIEAVGLIKAFEKLRTEHRLRVRGTLGQY